MKVCSTIPLELPFKTSAVLCNSESTIRPRWTPNLEGYYDFFHILCLSHHPFFLMKEWRIWWFISPPLQLFTVGVSSGIEARREKVITVGMSCTWDYISFKQMAAMYCCKQSCPAASMCKCDDQGILAPNEEGDSFLQAEEDTELISHSLLQAEICPVEDKYRYCYYYYLCLRRKDWSFCFLNKTSVDHTVLCRCLFWKEDFWSQDPK